MGIQVIYNEINDDTRNAIIDVVIDFMDYNEAFTSLDVANIVKQTHVVRNYRVAEVLRTLVLQIAYQRNIPYQATLIEVNTSKGKAHTYLYHRYTDDPENYQARNQKAIDPNVSTKQTTPNKVSIPCPPDWKVVQCIKCKGDTFGCAFCNYTGTLYISKNDRLAIAPGKSFRGQYPGLYNSL